MSGTTATVGAGTRLIDFYHGLAAKGRAVPGGSCPTVGIAGLTLGGGIGVTARAYGLTCDSLESLQIVTANGAVLTATASPGQYSDLFWACQGGGGGNFGVVTSFTFRTAAGPEPVLFSLSWPWSQAARVVAAWQSWAPNAPDALWSNLHLAAAPGGTTPSDHGRRLLPGQRRRRGEPAQPAVREGRLEPVEPLPQLPAALPDRDAHRGGLLLDRLPGLPPALVRERRQAGPRSRSSPSRTSSPPR